VNRITISGTVIAAMLVALPAAASHSFDDVPSSHAHHDSIDWLTQKGITSGCDSDSFCPHDPVTRAQMATFLRRYDQQADAPDQSQQQTSVKQHVIHSSGSGVIDCPPGTFVVGGGFLFSGQEQHEVYGSHPVARVDGFNREGWYVGVNDNGSLGSTVTWAVCLEVS
jgi:hypothetical protein